MLPHGLLAVSAIADSDCDVDDCIKVVAERVNCPDGWTCTNEAPAFLDCWENITGMDDAQISSSFEDHLARTPPSLGGVDIAVPTGTMIYAAKDGEVVEIEGSLPEGDTTTSKGNFVRIDYDDDTQGVYLHLKSVQVENGDKVTAGQAIGVSNKTGSGVTGAHLHYSQYDSRDGGDQVDPLLDHSHC